MNAMELCFIYRVRLEERVHPLGRYDALSDLFREWFKSNGLRYGLGALGGSRTIYGTVDGASEAILGTIRERFREWLSQLPMSALVQLGRLTRIEVANLMADDWEVSFDVDNLTEADRASASTYHTERLRQVELLGRNHPQE
ncbi:MAG: hypothetical protein U0792_01930 [Gemmataceae bacterium]